MSKRTNKKNRRRVAVLTTKVKARNPEDRVFLEREIPHKAYGSVYIVLDGNIGKYTQFATNSLKISRTIPIFQQASELAVTDPFVQFYRKPPFVTDEGEPIYTMAEAQTKARIAYLGDSGPLNEISESAFILGLLHYTDFQGELPDSGEDDREQVNEERAQYGLPPMPKRDMYSPLERKIDHVNYMIATDPDFGRELQASVSEAVEKVRQEGLLAEEDEELSEEGFQPPAVD